jgi:hypothetical protein
MLAIAKNSLQAICFLLILDANINSVVKLFDYHLKYVASKIHKDEHLPYQICVAKKKKWLHYLCAFSKCS